MPSLFDHIDRFTYTAQAIQTSSQNATTIRPTPYARAVLKTSLGDLARDVDASEIGLFTLVSTAPTTHQLQHHQHQQSLVDENGKENLSAVLQAGEIARVEFPGATPLRKPVGAPRHARREDEKEPEVYAEAALKYLDRYQSIRLMPRARQEVESIIERLNTLRIEIAQLKENEGQDVKAGPSAAVSTTQEEEKRIQELTMRIKQMKTRRDVLAKKQKKGTKPPALRATDKEEDAFWSESPAPATKGRKARKSLLIPSLGRGAEGPDDSLLLDARMDVDMGAMLNDVSMSSIAGIQPTPMQPLASKYRDRSDEKAKISLKMKEVHQQPQKQNTEKKKSPTFVSQPARSPTPTLQTYPTPVAREPIKRAAASSVPIADITAEVSYAEDDTEADQTIVFSKPPQEELPSPMETDPDPEPPREATPPPRRPSTPPRALEIPGVPTTPGPGVPATPGTAKKGRVKITTEIERIVARVWSTVGEIIMPGHPFNTAAAATTNKPPRAKETIALLQNLSTQRPPPASPTLSHSTFSITTTNTGPTPQAILTAYLLLALFDSPPNYSMSLASAKAVLAAVNKPEGDIDPAVAIMGTGSFGVGDKALETRALYGCVAKRLVKIDRNGREQIVRFDV